MGSAIEGSARRYLRARAIGETQEIENALAELRKSVAHADIEGDRALIDRFRDKAQETWDRDDGSIEIDDDAVVSFDEPGGAYVHAWIWVADREVPRE